MLHSALLMLLAALLTGRAEEPAVAAEQMPRVPATEPARAADTFAVRPGFHAELLAAEPLISSPVAVAVDEQGRAYVVEMRDYSERRPERLGRVRRLEDTDGDGRYDRATVFLDHLPWPTAITCWNGGVFLGATPDIWYAKDTNGDGVADLREPVFTGFASDYAPFATNQLNVQAMLNSFQWGLDNRIHGATSVSGGKVARVDSPFTRAWRSAGGASADQSLLTSSATMTHSLVDLRGRDFSFDPRTLELRAETGGGQHGMSFDDTGRKFVCSNSDHLQLIAFDAEGQPSNPFHDLPAARRSIAADGPAAEVFRRSPDEPWRVLRTRWRVAGLVPGPVEGGGRASGYFTGATGTTLYRGDAYGPDVAGDAFIGDAGGNLVHRKKLHPTNDGLLLVGERASDEARSEFLASTDNWFRPVQFYNGPDGCLWVVDMYRETIEHPWSLPENLKARLDLDSGRERGRLWRLAPDGFEATGARLKLEPTDSKSLVAALGNPNGWHRDTAARLLYERGDTNGRPALQALLLNSTNRLARLHALNTLGGLGGLEEVDLIQALGDSDSAVRRHAVRRAAGQDSAVLRKAMVMLAEDSDPLVRLELALAVAHWPPPERVEPLVRLFRGGPELVVEVALHAVGTSDVEVFVRLVDAVPPADREILAQVARLIGRRNDASAVDTVIREILEMVDQERALTVAASLGEGLRQAGSSLSTADREHRLTSLTARARAIGKSATSLDQARSGAIRYLTQLPWPDVQDVLTGLLAAGNDLSSQALGVAAVGSFADPEATRSLVAALPALRPEPRRQAMARLLRRTDGTRALLAEVEAEQVAAADFSVEQMNSLRRHEEAAIRDRSRRLWGDLPASRAEVVTQFLPALSQRGDSGRGAEVFRERCATCHAFRGAGVGLGPDLASVVSNGPEKLLVSILDPNREVAPNFTAWTAETRGGETVTGLLVRESDSSVTLKQAGGTELTLARSDLLQLRPEGRSLMPEGLEAGMSVADLAALLAWMSEGR